MQKGTKKLSTNSCNSLLFCDSAVFAVPNAENRNETNRLGLHVTMYLSVVRDKAWKTSFISRKSKLARTAIFPGDNTIIRRLYPFFIQEGNKNLAANRLLTTLKKCAYGTNITPTFLSAKHSSSGQNTSVRTHLQASTLQLNACMTWYPPPCFLPTSPISRRRWSGSTKARPTGCISMSWMGCSCRTFPSGFLS